MKKLTSFYFDILIFSLSRIKNLLYFIKIKIILFVYYVKCAWSDEFYNTIQENYLFNIFTLLLFAWKPLFHFKKFSLLQNPLNALKNSFSFSLSHTHSHNHTLTHNLSFQTANYIFDIKMSVHLSPLVWTNKNW